MTEASGRELFIRIARIGVLVGVLLACGWGLAAAPKFAIYPLGPLDAEHRSHLGFYRSSVNDFNDQRPGVNESVITGSAYRYSGTQYVGDSSWAFNRDRLETELIGLRTPDFFYGASGNHRSTIYAANALGQVIGLSDTDPTSSMGKQIPWFYDPVTSTTHRIGYGQLVGQTVSESVRFLTDDGKAYGTAGFEAWVYDHATGLTETFGPDDSLPVWQGAGRLKHTLIDALPGGQVLGSSERSVRLSSPPLWVYDHATGVTTPIGFTGPEHRRPSGELISNHFATTSSNLIVGSSRFQTASRLSSDAWVFDPSTQTTSSIGLANPFAGAAWSDELVDTRDNWVFGQSTLTNGTMAPWAYDHQDQSLRQFGLTDATHTLAGGVTKNQIRYANESGFVAGRAARTGGEIRQSFNQTPWVYSPLTNTTYATGLTTGAYRLSDGSVWNDVLDINSQGQAIGMAVKFVGSASVIDRHSSWFFDSATGSTIELVATFANIRRANYTGAQLMNDNGVVVGVASGITVGSQWVWLYDHRTKTTRLDFEYQVPGGSVVSSNGDIELIKLTDSGLVLGQTKRDTGSGDVGYSDWLYDSNTRITHSLVFSENRSNGAAFTQVDYLGEDGVMFGLYDAYDTSNQLLGRRYFYWSIADGFHDLESLVQGDLSVLGGRLQFDPSAAPRLRIISPDFMYGSLYQSSSSYIPLAFVRVPEPATATLIFIVALARVPHRPHRASREA
jgi:hypothetical protein